MRYRGEVVPGSDAEFKQFESMAYGYRAMFVLLDTYRRRYGLNTIRMMLNRYAPPEENFTEAYIRIVSQRTGIAPDQRINTLSARDMIPVVCAMSAVENGEEAVREDVERGWQLYVGK